MVMKPVVWKFCQESRRYDDDITHKTVEGFRGQSVSSYFLDHRSFASLLQIFNIMKQSLFFVEFMSEQFLGCFIRLCC